MTKGLLSEERFATLTVSLENEQRQLKADIPALENSLNATADKADDLQKFIQRARQVTRLTELTPEIVHEFIDKIVVSKPEKLDGKRHQRVDIYYSTIGLWTAPDPETLEQEYMAYYNSMQKRRKRQRSRSYAVQIGNLSFTAPAVRGNFLTGAAPTGGRFWYPFL
ncbi:DUF4368 domain-containing protein [Flavonifractor plautii]|nr:DUF4368 domain-containing protein [Flavonifractor plautii]